MALLEIYLGFKKLDFSVSTSALFLEWFTTSNKFDKYITEMSKPELNYCLKQFYTSAKAERWLVLQENNNEVRFFARLALIEFLKKTTDK